MLELFEPVTYVDELRAMHPVTRDVETCRGVAAAFMPAEADPTQYEKMEVTHHASPS